MPVVQRSSDADGGLLESGECRATRVPTHVRAAMRRHHFFH